MSNLLKQMQNNPNLYFTRRNVKALKSKPSLTVAHQAKLPNPLLLPNVSSPERPEYIKLRRDPGSIVPQICGETVRSIAEISSSVAQ